MPIEREPSVCLFFHYECLAVFDSKEQELKAQYLSISTNRSADLSVDIINNVYPATAGAMEMRRKR